MVGWGREFLGPLSPQSQTCPVVGLSQHSSTSTGAAWHPNSTFRWGQVGWVGQNFSWAPPPQQQQTSILYQCMIQPTMALLHLHPQKRQIFAWILGGREGFLPFPQWIKVFTLYERMVQEVGKTLSQFSIGGLSLVSFSAPNLYHEHRVEVPWKRACRSVQTAVMSGTPRDSICYTKPHSAL